MNQLDEFQNGEETGTLKDSPKQRRKVGWKKRNSTVISWYIACCYAVLSSRAPVCVCVPRRKGRDAITRARKVSSDSAPALPCLPSGMCITPATNRMFCTLYKNKRVGGCTLSIYKENASSTHTHSTHTLKKKGNKNKTKNKCSTHRFLSSFSSRCQQQAEEQNMKPAKGGCAARWWLCVR